MAPTQPPRKVVNHPLGPGDVQRFRARLRGRDKKRLQNKPVSQGELNQAETRIQNIEARLDQAINNAPPLVLTAADWGPVPDYANQLHDDLNDEIVICCYTTVVNQPPICIQMTAQQCADLEGP
jgi:hypothetical protein